MSPYSELLAWTKANIQTRSTVVTDPNNVFIGETDDLLSLNDTHFPRIEIQIVGAPNQDYLTQRILEKRCQISVQGYLRRPADEIVEQDMFDIADFHHDTEKVIFNIHDQILAGAPGTPTNFTKISGMTEAFVVVELMPKTSSFLFNFTGEFSARDVA